jgi:hypothetical protein
MLAKRSLGLLPPLTPTQALETSMIKSIFGELAKGGVHVSHRFDRCIIPPRTRQLLEAGGMQNLANSALPIMAFCSWMNFPNSAVQFWKAYDSLWKTGM